MTTYLADVESRQVRVEINGDVSVVRIDGSPVTVSHVWVGGSRRDLLMLVNGRSYDFRIEEENEHLVLGYGGRRYRCSVADERLAGWKQQEAEGHRAPGRTAVKSPMPGLIVKVVCTPGATVHKGDRLLVIEAMKMENDVKSPCAGTVAHVRVQPGEAVEGGRELVVIES